LGGAAAPGSSAGVAASAAIKSASGMTIPLLVPEIERPVGEVNGRSTGGGVVALVQRRAMSLNLRKSVIEPSVR
jgi:hypothetical protein